MPASIRCRAVQNENSEALKQNKKGKAEIFTNVKTSAFLVGSQGFEP